MYLKQSIGRPAGSPGRGIQPYDSVELIDVDDVLYYPGADDNGVKIVDDIVLKPGKYAIAIYMTPGTAEVASNSDGDTDAEGFTPSVKFKHPGNSIEVREFKANCIGKKYLVVVRYCGVQHADLIGTPCNPCKLAVAYTGSNDSNANEITFTQIAKGEDIFAYLGTVPLEEPVSVVDAAATSVPFSTPGQYQLSAGEANIVNINGGSDGAVITLLGVAGASPSVSATDSGNILLKGGMAFNATAGSQLTLRAFSAGPNKLVWIEQSRHVSI